MYEHLTGEQLEEIGRRRYEARKRDQRRNAVTVGIVVAIFVTAITGIAALF